MPRKIKSGLNLIRLLYRLYLYGYKIKAYESAIIEIPRVPFKYRYSPRKSQELRAQELFEAEGLGGKLEKIFTQGQKTTAFSNSDYFVGNMGYRKKT